MESEKHQKLKRAAISYLRERGCVIHALEVRCPIAKFRIDVVGYLDRSADPTSGGFLRCPPRVIAIECKQSRCDFFCDDQEREPLLELQAKYERIRRSIEEDRIKVLEPQLRCEHSSLFSELDDWNFRLSGLPGYRAVLNRLRLIDRKLHGETKFFTMMRYRLADELYLAIPQGLLRDREVPTGWGCLEFSEAEQRLIVRRPAPDQRCKPLFQHRMLRNIAAAASRNFADRV